MNLGVIAPAILIHRNYEGRAAGLLIGPKIKHFATFACFCSSLWNFDTAL